VTVRRLEDDASAILVTFGPGRTAETSGRWNRQPNRRRALLDRDDDPSAASLPVRGGRDVVEGTAPVDAAPVGPTLTSDEVWQHLAKASFTVISFVTPNGDPRSSGVLFKAVGKRLFVVVAPDSWKARHIAADPRVALTVTIRRGGLISLVAPIPPATISFHGSAVVHPPDSLSIPDELASLVPPERRSSSTIIEVAPEGTFVTYGIGVALMKMRTPALSRARVPVGPT
jgi:hypothetical protein